MKLRGPAADLPNLEGCNSDSSAGPFTANGNSQSFSSAAPESSPLAAVMR